MLTGVMRSLKPALPRLQHWHNSLPTSQVQTVVWRYHMIRPVIQKKKKKLVISHGNIGSSL